VAATDLVSNVAPLRASSPAQENNCGNFLRDNPGASIAIAAVAIGPLIYWGVNEAVKKIFSCPERKPEK
jgi:hypothetical protein